MSPLFHIHIPIWQNGSCIHLAMPTKPPPILINSLHPNNAIQLTLYINKCVQYDYIENQIQSCTVHLHLHNKYSFQCIHSVHFHLVYQRNNQFLQYFIWQKQEDCSLFGNKTGITGVIIKYQDHNQVFIHKERRAELSTLVLCSSTFL